MAKQQSQPSVKKRREAMRQQEEAKQRQRLILGGVVLFLLVAAVFAWQTWLLQREETAVSDTPSTLPTTSTDPLVGDLMAGDAERPLSSIPPTNRDGYYSQPPDMVIDPNKAYEAIIQLESGGEMRLRLFAAESPLTVNNFVYLANEGFYDGVIFHRVIPNFMAQGGDPSGSGRGGPGYMFADETDNGLGFDRPGLLAMANAGPNTNGSQFFITFVPTPHLDGGHTIFGEIVAGEDVLFGIPTRDPMAGGSAAVIARIDIIEGN